MLEESYLTLSQLNRDIRTVLEGTFFEDCWIVAEVAEISPRGRRHCYLQLVEKVEESVIAQSRATLWSSRTFLLDEFEAVTGETLKPGMEVLLRVTVRYHEVYGLSLDIISINPVFTLGGMARKKRETLERLAAEGLFERNGRLPFPLVPHRIAIISSATAAGLGDFVVHLNSNPDGFVFSYALFPAAVQGSEAEASLIGALEEVASRADLFDVAVILRGGGSQIDLSCFDGYALAACIARCPLPVLTGIGHEKDETVADLVAYARARTPTAAAEMLLERMRAYEERLVGAQDMLLRYAAQVVESRRTALERAAFQLSRGVARHTASHERRLETAARRFILGAQSRLASEEDVVGRAAARLRYRPFQTLDQERMRAGQAARELRREAGLSVERQEPRVDALERAARLLDPAHVLRRGYSITRLNGRAVKSAEGLAAGDRLTTEVAAGTIDSTVNEVGTKVQDAVGERTE